MSKPSDSYRILHTADWHLGKTLEGQSREEEHDLFLAWLLERVSEHEVDAVLVAGDVFDSGMPPQTAVHRYFEFVSRLRERGECKLVVIGGNHDSANQLEAPVPVLEYLGARVDGRVKEEPAERILLLPDSENPRVRLRWFPFLRDADIRKGRAGRPRMKFAKAWPRGSRKNTKRRPDFGRLVLSGFGNGSLDGHRHAFIRQRTGHCRRLGRRLAQGFSRAFRIRCLGAFASSAKPGRKPGALLGFTHPLELQRGGGCKGSTSPGRFSGWHKRLSLPIPRFRNLVQLKVSFDELESRIMAFSPDASELTPWVEVVVEGAIFGDELSNRVRELAEGKDYEILKVVRVKAENEEGGAILADGEDYEFVLDHPDQVFERLLDQKEVTDEAEAKG